MFEDRKLTSIHQEIAFNGSPFIVIGSKYYDCTNGLTIKLQEEKKKFLHALKRRLVFFSSFKKSNLLN